MKVKILSLAVRSGIALLLLVCIGVPHLYAGPPSQVVKANTKPTIEVLVPEDGQPVTYVLGNKKWTIQPGQSAVLPAGATRIYMPKGTIITLIDPSAKSMEPTRSPYTVNQPITLAGLTPQSIRDNQQFIIPGITPGGSGNIGLPSPTLQELITAVSSLAQTTVNPFNVLNTEVTDGN